MRISNWSSDVCSSDLEVLVEDRHCRPPLNEPTLGAPSSSGASCSLRVSSEHREYENPINNYWQNNEHYVNLVPSISTGMSNIDGRSEEHTSELQSLMRISYAVFCLKKKKK